MVKLAAELAASPDHKAIDGSIAYADEAGEKRIHYRLDEAAAIVPPLQRGEKVLLILMTKDHSSRHEQVAFKLKYVKRKKQEFASSLERYDAECHELHSGQGVVVSSTQTSWVIEALDQQLVALAPFRLGFTSRLIANKLNHY